MAKKSRRARQRTSKAAEPVRLPEERQPMTKRSKKAPVDFAKEYHYVIEDLKRIAITAGALLVLLILLAILIA